MDGGELPITCGNCGLVVLAKVLNSNGTGTFWLLCPGCREGSVKVTSGAVYPAAAAGAPVNGLPDDVAQAWREARTVHAVAAYTASEILCRKILMHLAVDVAGGKPGDTFQAYIEHLDKAGYIGAGLRPAVEKIKNRGNVANHALPSSTEADSVITLKITEHLLRGIYEIPGL